MSVVANMKIIVEHGFIGDGVKKRRNHIRHTGDNENSGSILDVHTTSVPVICIISDSLFEEGVGSGGNLSSKRMIAIESEIWELIQTGEEGTQVKRSSIDDLLIVSIGRCEIERIVHLL